jgi:hypothetical protein
MIRGELRKSQAPLIDFEKQAYVEIDGISQLVINEQILIEIDI